MLASKLSRVFLAFCVTAAKPVQHDGKVGSSESTVVQIGSRRFSDMVLPSCGLWSRRGVIWTKTYTDGSRLEMWCRRTHWFGIFPSYNLFYVEQKRRPRCIGRCIFRSGCNAVTVVERIGAGEERLDQTIWQNVDGGSNDGVAKITATLRAGPKEPMLDEVDWEFDADQKTLTVTNKQYAYLPGYKVAQGCDVDRFRGELAHVTVRVVP